MKKCVICETVITSSNDSEEHLIPNSIGGRKKIKGFICEKHNNETGRDWESELAKQLNPLCLFFNVSRERGEIPSQIFETISGKKIQLNAESSMDLDKPSYEEKSIGTEIQIIINARSMSEAKKMLKGVKRKYPQANLEELISNSKQISTYSPEAIKFNLSFGGQKAGRSIVKSALSLAYEAGVPHSYCIPACNYLRDINADACFGYYYEKDLIKNRPAGIPLHCIAIQGDPKTKLLLGYVEFFGIQRMVVYLSESYDGPQILKNYSINPINGEELKIDVEIALSIDDKIAIYNYDKISKGAIEAALDEVIPAGMAASFEKEKKRLLNEAVRYGFENCGVKEGEILTQEHMLKLTELVIDKMKPFILHQYRLRRNQI